jgi:hypothetical protein
MHPNRDATAPARQPLPAACKCPDYADSRIPGRKTGRKIHICARRYVTAETFVCANSSGLRQVTTNRLHQSTEQIMQTSASMFQNHVKTGMGA